MAAKGNAVVIHGGGLVDPSKIVLMRLAKDLVKKVYDKVYIGKYSFISLYKPEFLVEYNKVLQVSVEDKRGGYFGTCRDVFLTDPALAERAIACLKEREISTVIVAGGDGSSRQVAEIIETFSKNAINIIFAVPLTIDGINGGISIGVNEAVLESIRQIENMASTSLETMDGEEFGVVIIELQGRNRDDILAGVLSYFCDKKKVADCPISELLLKVIPATIWTNEEALIRQINNSSKRTLILLSEGAEIKMQNLSKKIVRKVRSLVIGHPSQANEMTTNYQRGVYENYIQYICNTIIAFHPKESYCIESKALIIPKAAIQPIDYYAKLNPKKNQKAKLPQKLDDLMRSYMA